MEVYAITTGERGGTGQGGVKITNGRVLSPNSSEYKNAVLQQIAIHKQSGKDSQKLAQLEKALRGATDSGVVITASMVQGDANDAIMNKFRAGTSNNASLNNQSNNVTNNTVGMKNGGKLQQGGQISENYFKKVELPDISIDDLF